MEGWITGSVNETTMDSFIGVIILFAVCIFLYFIPTWIAWNKRNADSVAVVNLFFGWTFIGWVIALAMACNNDKPIIVKTLKPKHTTRMDELVKLKSLLDSGALTEDEYQREKERLLNHREK